jgi:GTP pyrophosphokinase
MATDTIAHQLKHKDTDSLCVALGSGDLTSASIATALQQLRGPDTAPKQRPKRTSRRKQQAPDTVAIRGVGDLMSNFARCCRPVPPEPITGYITQGRGVSIHRQDCGNLLGLNRRHPERVIEVDWGQDDDARYPVDLTLHAIDRSGLLRDVSAVLADELANVTDLETHADRKSLQTVMHLSVEISDLPALSTTIARLERIPNVVSVRRRA